MCSENNVDKVMSYRLTTAMTPSYGYSTTSKPLPQRCRTWFLGSLQLLFWLVFRPSRWSSYLQSIHPHLGNSRLMPTSQRWVHPFGRLMIEEGILLPVLINGLISGLGFSNASSIASFITIPASTLVIHLVISISLALLIGIAGGYVVTDLRGEIEGTAAGVVLAIAFSITINLLTNLLLTDAVEFPADSASSTRLIVLVFLSLLIGLAIGSAAGLGYSATHGYSVVEWSESVRLVFGLPLLLGMLVGGVFELVGGAIALDTLHFMPGFAIGIGFGLAVAIGLSVNLWRPLLTYPLFLPWQLLLYVLDQHRLNPRHPDVKKSLIRWHPAFWDELQYLPLWGLDRHLAFVWRCNPQEGKVAQQRLQHTYQAWAARRLETLEEERGCGGYQES